MSIRTYFANLITANVGITRDDHPLRMAFAATPREKFVGPGPWRIFTAAGYIDTPSDDPQFIYQDVTVALDQQSGINNGQPTLHALCIAPLDIKPSEAIVHVGAGTGYYTALLARITGPSGSVDAYEIDSHLADRATSNLQDLPNVTVHNSSGSEASLPDCDVIYVSAGVTTPVEPWLHALRVGGRLLLPMTGARNHGGMLLITKTTSGQFGARFLCRAAFIPCVGARDVELEEKLADAFKQKEIAQVKSLRFDKPVDASCWFEATTWWLSTSV